MHSVHSFFSFRFIRLAFRRAAPFRYRRRSRQRRISGPVNRQFSFPPVSALFLRYDPGYFSENPTNFKLNLKIVGKLSDFPVLRDLFHFFHCYRSRFFRKRQKFSKKIKIRLTKPINESILKDLKKVFQKVFS